MRPEPAHVHGEARSPPSRWKWVFAGFAAGAGYLLVSEHRAHAIEYLPYLILLACPLMHFFMHHGGHGRRDEGDSR